MSKSIKKIFFDLKSNIAGNPVGSDEGLIQFDYRHFDYSSGRLKAFPLTLHGQLHSESDFLELNYIDKVLLPEFHAEDGQHPPYSFFGNHLLKIAFHNEALLSDWQATARFNFSIDAFSEISSNNNLVLSKSIRSINSSFSSSLPSTELHGSPFGLFSLGASSALFMRSGNLAYPVIPVLFFGVYPIHSQQFDNTISNSYKNIRLYPFILQGFIVLVRRNQGNQFTNHVALIFVHRFRSVHTKPIHHSDFNRVLGDQQSLRNNYILVSKEHAIKFDVYCESYISGAIERKRYILRVENLNPESSYRYAAVRYDVPIVKTRVETENFYESLPDQFENIFTNNTTVFSGHVVSDSFLVASYADRLGIFESCFVENVEQNNVVQKKICSLNPEVNLFQIYVNYSRDSDIAIISDSVGLGYGVSTFERSSTVPVLGSSFASELKRTVYRQSNNLSKIFLSIDDVLQSLNNIKFLNPSYIVLFLGLDTVARLAIRHESLFQVSNVNIDGQSFILYKFFRPKNFSLIEIFDSDSTIQPSQYFLEKLFNQPSGSNSRKGLYQFLKEKTSANIVVVGFPPVNNPSANQVDFYRYYFQYSFSNSSSNNTVLPFCLQYSSRLQQASLYFDFYINLSYELGNPTSYDVRYVCRYSNPTDNEQGTSAIYFNSSGHNVLKDLIFGIIREQVFRTTTLMNQRDIDVRLSITKFVSKQKVYSLQDNQNYRIQYDAKLDIVLPIFRTDEDFRKLDIATNELYNMLIVVPYAGSVAIRLQLESGETTNLLLTPNRPTMLFVPFTEIFLRNNSEIEVPVTIIVGKTN